MDKQLRLVLIISILASSVAFLDGSVVNVALPAISRQFGGGLQLQQWVVDAYMLTFGSLMLIAGALSDLFGRRKILFYGLAGFLVASILCAFSPSGLFLVVARVVQGVAGALLVPSSLALIMSSFSGESQSRAIGRWTAWTAIAFIVAPLLGGFLIDAASWRLIFIINVLPIGVTLWSLKKLTLPEHISERVKLDTFGSFLCVVALAGISFGLIEQSHYGFSSPLIYLTLSVGIVSLIGFIWYEHHAPHPMMPLSLYSVRNFSVGNLATFTIYGALAIAVFLITIYLQQVGGYSAIAAGLALLPVTILMFLLSGRFGTLAGKYGPRLFMSVGPLIASAGFFMMLTIGSAINYWTQLLPGVFLYGLGLSITVAPLTSAILGSISNRQAGIGSAVNNAISRIAGLLAVAAIGIVVGPSLNVAGFHRGIITTAILMAIGGIISAIGIQNTRHRNQQVVIRES